MEHYTVPSVLIHLLYNTMHRLCRLDYGNNYDHPSQQRDNSQEFVYASEETVPSTFDKLFLKSLCSSFLCSQFDHWHSCRWNCQAHTPDYYHYSYSMQYRTTKHTPLIPTR
eukprot:9950776-Ditylum_brightwellii.AAC.1